MTAQLWQVIGISDPEGNQSPAGLAIDLGTSRVVLRLVDLATQEILSETAFNNPQITIGPDVLARIHHTDKEGGLAQLNRLIIERLNQAIAAAANEVGLDREDIYLLAVAGNTTMSHLFMGLDPHWIIREPYIPVVNRPDPMMARDLGLKVNPLARVLVFPNIGSYFGGDLIAGILHAGLHTSSDTAILVDVGTNAEVVLGNSQWLIACAGAAGPALEGGVTRMGMMAEPGVIDRIAIDPATRKLTLHTIEDQPPKGICGSGLIDLAAQLFLTGMIDLRGRLVPASCGKRLQERDGVAYLTVVSPDQSATGQDLGISQIDLDSLIRSKAAMYTILETLTASVGMRPEALETFFVAGTFGSFINPRIRHYARHAARSAAGKVPFLGQQFLGRCHAGPLCCRSNGRIGPDQGPDYVPGVERKPGVHESLFSSQIYSAHEHLSFPIGPAAPSSKCIVRRCPNKSGAGFIF